REDEYACNNDRISDCAAALRGIRSGVQVVLDIQALGPCLRHGTPSTTPGGSPVLNLRALGSSLRPLSCFIRTRQVVPGVARILLTSGRIPLISTVRHIILLFGATVG